MLNIVAYGDRAVLINFEQRIAPGVNQMVIALKTAIETTRPKGFEYCIPAYCSLTVGFDPLQTDFAQFSNEIEALKAGPKDPTERSGRLLRIPVCYEAAYAPDLEEVQSQTGLSGQEIIDLHTQESFRVYMLGFLPGFVYLGTLDQKLHCRRRFTPRLRVPARSVGIAGVQTGIYPSEAPGGWQLIGRTPVNTFDSRKPDPFLFEAGDQVQFYAVTAEKYLQIESESASGNFDIQSLYG